MTDTTTADAEAEAAAQALDDLAQLIRRHPELAPVVTHSKLWLYVTEPWDGDESRHERMSRLVKALEGGQRTVDDRYVHVCRRFGPLEVDIFTRAGGGA